jgi:diketogulonate reductase-like aldo/keto reductase
MLLLQLLLLLLLLLSSHVSGDTGSVRVQTSTGRIGGVFRLLEQTLSSRPTYQCAESQLYLFFLAMGGVGRWLVSANLGANDGIAYVDAWAVTPALIGSAAPHARWRVADTYGWLPDASFTVTPEDGFDRAVYVSSVRQPQIGGFFVETGKRAGGRAVHERVGSEVDNALFLYYLEDSHRWIVGDAPGTPNGLAYAASSARTAFELFAETPTWFVVDAAADDAQHRWLADETFQLISGSPVAGVFDMLRLTANAANQRGRAATVRLHDGAAMPLIGFGTGGTLARDALAGALLSAVQNGWVLVDTAEQYDNEQVIGSLFAQRQLQRNALYLTTKVWPTHLGFGETLRSVYDSLSRLRTSYANLVLIHWPRCIHDALWMNCSGASPGTWKESYRALERLYAEGRTLAIGVSNFQVADVDELFAMVPAVTPHVVQNWMSPAHHDFAVLDRAYAHGVHYQAYSPLRSIVAALAGSAPDADTKLNAVVAALRGVAAALGRSVASVAIRWLTQQGASVVVSATSGEHQRDAMSACDFNLTWSDMQRIGDAGALTGQRPLAQNFIAAHEEEPVEHHAAAAHNNDVAPDLPRGFFKSAESGAWSTSTIVLLCIAVLAAGAAALVVTQRANDRKRKHFD